MRRIRFSPTVWVVFPKPTFVVSCSLFLAGGYSHMCGPLRVYLQGKLGMLSRSNFKHRLWGAPVRPVAKTY